MWIEHPLYVISCTSIEYRLCIRWMALYHFIYTYWLTILIYTPSFTLFMHDWARRRTAYQLLVNKCAMASIVIHSRRRNIFKQQFNKQHNPSNLWNATRFYFIFKNQFFFNCMLFSTMLQLQKYINIWSIDPPTNLVDSWKWHLTWVTFKIFLASINFPIDLKF